MFDGTPSRQKRREKLKKLYDEQVLEFTEDNGPTSVSVFLEDVLRALPIGMQQNVHYQWEAIFEDALKEAGIKNQEEV